MNDRKLRFIMMSCGYAESGQTSWLIYQCQFFGRYNYYSSYKEAITDLALDLYAKFYDDHLSIYQNRYNKEVKDCCRKTLVSNKEAKFCFSCGERIVDKIFDDNEFMNYVCELHNTTSDSYGDAEETSTRDLTWWPFWGTEFIGTPKEEVICIAENAEIVLLDALVEAKPELKEAAENVNINHNFFESDWEKFKKDIQPSYK